MSGNTLSIDSLTKCRFNMGEYACFSFDKLLLVIAVVGILFIALSIIMKINNTQEMEG